MWLPKTTFLRSNDPLVIALLAEHDRALAKLRRASERMPPCEMCGSDREIRSLVRGCYRCGDSECATHVRHQLWMEQAQCCGHCGQLVEPDCPMIFACRKWRVAEVTVSVDHIIPTSRGGPDKRWNLQLVHSACNSSKSNRMTAAAWLLAFVHDVAVRGHNARDDALPLEFAAL